ncbi:PHB depolymerase family esterase [Rhodopila sp.]|jgi:poly(hydroxyalkanoate) depolymerase family esterase|uniref:extracellular catalytic domain type 1 short-chain-length polyhydroxyalkanoate depolymerase n=1 Tax=Rhodopila sp. TaxID=2480087 RepID=UPI002C0435E2|nr:PHB depolymerase family esterase [Rhodopila sp.]HVZ10771.1 PHB depolymerase family esterase [Rhodopila sp.]
MKLPFSNALSDVASAVQRVLGGLAPPLPDLSEALPTPSRPLVKPVPVAKPVMRGPRGGRIEEHIFTGPAGARPYKLYIPSGYRGQPVPLIVMLHGCTQSPDDFAVGTRMNQAAEAETCLVAWPRQVKTANLHKCWNWFREGDQQRGSGEPSVITGIVHQVMREYAVDKRRVYVAGLSAGGAAAAVLGETYPDLFAAVGVHSGLPCGAAHDASSAFVAMKTGSDGVIRRAGSGLPPTIVFHGDRDGTVNPRNGDSVVAQAISGQHLRAESTQGMVPDGHAWRRTRYRDADGMVKVEQWVIHGGGHAWSGGSADGSFTDPQGPDATAAMMRFFLAHPLAHPSAHPSARQ